MKEKNVPSFIDDDFYNTKYVNENETISEESSSVNSDESREKKEKDKKRSTLAKWIRGGSTTK